MPLDFSRFGVSVPDILLPDEKVDLSKWAVIACDQFTSNRQYWQQAESIVGTAPSALRLVLPEIDLGQAAERIPKIQKEMRLYCRDILTRTLHGMLYTERQTTAGLRRGLLLALDLEAYEYTKGSRSLIRATEGTVTERIPPRVRIRRGACLELPHVLVLVDDPARKLIEPLRAQDLPLLYETELMLRGGHIRGYAVTGEKLRGVYDAFDALLAGAREKDPEAPLLFAVGDGNHSLASAKAYWEEVKETLPPAAWKEHPARFALVEINNVRDEAMAFAPIHRAVFGADLHDILPAFRSYLAGHPGPGGSQLFPWHCGTQAGSIPAAQGSHVLPVGTLQGFLDRYKTEHPEITIDYIHGDEELAALAKNGALTFELQAMDKASLFPAVSQSGALPRKTFSLGQAEDKRYYLESRKIEP